MDQKDLIWRTTFQRCSGDLMEEYCPPKAMPTTGTQGLKDAVFTRSAWIFIAEGVKPEALNRQELGDAIFES